MEEAAELVTTIVQASNGTTNRARRSKVPFVCCKSARVVVNPCGGRGSGWIGTDHDVQQCSAMGWREPVSHSFITHHRAPFRKFRRRDQRAHGRNVIGLKRGLKRKAGPGNDVHRVLEPQSLCLALEGLAVVAGIHLECIGATEYPLVDTVAAFGLRGRSYRRVELLCPGSGL